VCSSDLYAEKLSGERADAVMNMLQNMQVNSEDRDMAIRLLKTGRWVGSSIYVTFNDCDHLHIYVSLFCLETLQEIAAVQNYIL
jgi:hypothetical protein